ncbi:MAG: type II secretion system protein [Phycisphaeraceae bacterium]|nr:type II secretion system protein [Phycisphaeraceae bacterium]
MKTVSRAVGNRGHRRGVTLVEILAVIGVLVILMAILLPSLATVRGNAVLMKSYNNLRQVANYSAAYSKDNRETIVPSAFDYSQAATPGKVRSNRRPDGTEPPPPAGMLRKGTWADILWTTAGLGPASTDGNYRWEFDAPDGYFYSLNPDFEGNPFRSTQPMYRVFEGSSMSTDSAINANDLGSRALPEHVPQPGMFAMNNFFDSRGGNWFSTHQIRHPARGLMLVDSFAGETIDPVETSTVAPWRGNSSELGQVDFRYIGGVAAILFFDGHTDAQPKWDDLEELQGDDGNPQDNGRNVRVTNLDRSGT